MGCASQLLESNGDTPEQYSQAQEGFNQLHKLFGELTMETFDDNDTYTPIVDTYTPEERALVTPGDNETPAQKMQRREDTAGINTARYQRAMEARPDMTDHFAFQIMATENSLNAWRKIYAETGEIAQ